MVTIHITYMTTLFNRVYFGIMIVVNTIIIIMNTPGDDSGNNCNEGIMILIQDDEDEGKTFNWNDRGYGVDLAS